MKKEKDVNASFLPGLELSCRFYEELVKPLLEEAFPALPYAAALVGPGDDFGTLVY